MNTEIQTIANILSNPHYTLTDQDIATPTVTLALEAQKKPKYIAREYKYECEEQIIPPAYQPSKEEIALAMASHAMEYHVWSIIHYMQEHIEILNGKEPLFPYTREGIKKSYESAWQEWDKAMHKWDDDNEIWDCLVDKDWFDKAYVQSLSDMHSGDCTAFASSCSRCQAEQAFKLPFSANWKGGKGEGLRLYNRYVQHVPLQSPTSEDSSPQARPDTLPT